MPFLQARWYCLKAWYCLEPVIKEYSSVFEFMTPSTVLVRNKKRLHTVKNSNDIKFFIFKIVFIKKDGNYIFEAAQHGSEKSC